MASTTVQLRPVILFAAVLLLGAGFMATRPSAATHRDYRNQDFGFRIEIPSGYQAVTDANGVLVVPIPIWWDVVTRHVLVPVMAVRVRPAGRGGGYPAGAVVQTKSGRDYVVYPWQSLKWPLFNKVANSFSFIKR
jgi:hypothetical protein